MSDSSDQSDLSDNDHIKEYNMIENKGITRRDFLKTTGMTVAGMALVPGLVYGGENKVVDPTKKLRIGIVGGGFGTSFQWHEHPNCVVEAVSDLRPERLQLLKDVYKCDKGYESLEKLILDKNIDAVAVFTGAPDHARHDIACLKAGKHVISAVPACMTLEEAEELEEMVRKTGLKYMMAETSYFHQSVISARNWFKEGKFGEIYYTEAEYHHPGLEVLFHENGKPTWRHGLPPMNYPTHCTGYLVGVTKERMTQVTCTGWGDDSEKLKNNQYNNPFWNETAMFTTDKGHSFRVGVYWKAPVGGCERGQWYGTKMSFFDPSENGQGPVIRRPSDIEEKDDAGFVRKLSAFEQYDQPKWWKTSMLPEPLRHESGHDGSHCFITNEFVTALLEDRMPKVSIYEALAMTVPGIVAHKSALEGGKSLKIPCFDRKA